MSSSILPAIVLPRAKADHISEAGQRTPSQDTSESGGGASEDTLVTNSPTKSSYPPSPSTLSPPHKKSRKLFHSSPPQSLSPIHSSASDSFASAFTSPEGPLFVEDLAETWDSIMSRPKTYFLHLVSEVKSLRERTAELENQKDALANASSRLDAELQSKSAVILELEKEKESDAGELGRLRAELESGSNLAARLKEDKETACRQLDAQNEISASRERETMELREKVSEMNHLMEVDRAEHATATQYLEMERNALQTQNQALAAAVERGRVAHAVELAERDKRFADVNTMHGGVYSMYEHKLREVESHRDGYRGVIDTLQQELSVRQNDLELAMKENARLEGEQNDPVMRSIKDSFQKVLELADGHKELERQAQLAHLPA